MDHLHACAFSGEPVDADKEAPPCSSEIPTEPESQADLVMLSMPETQYDAEKVAAGGSGTQEQDDVFHTPPEKSSVPRSGDMPPSQPGKLNHDIDAHDDEALGFVDSGDSQGNGCVNLGRDSEIGLSEVQLLQGVGGELVAQSPRGIKRDAVAEESEGSERETCISELPVKKSKLSEPSLGLESSGTCLGIESQELKEGNGNCNFGGDVEPEKVDLAEEQVSKDVEISVQKNMGSCNGNEANELGSVEPEKVDLADEPVPKDIEISVQKNVGSCNGNEADGLGSVTEEGQKENKKFVFEVLKFLSENSDDDYEDDSENDSLGDVVNIAGINFPRPRWWRDDV